MLKTVHAFGHDFEVEFEGTPFTPARRHGHPDNWMPAEGGEAEIVSVCLEGIDLTDCLSDHVTAKILEDLTIYLCSGQAEDDYVADHCD